MEMKHFMVMYLSAREGCIRFHRCLVMFSESQSPRAHAWFVFVGLLHMWGKKKRGQKEAHACLYVVAKGRQSQTDCGKWRERSWQKCKTTPRPHCRWAQSQSRIMTQGKFHTFPGNVPWFYLQLWFRMTFYSVWSLLILILILCICTVSVTHL